MQNNTIANGINIQEMVSTMYQLQDIKKAMPVGVKVTLDFYKKIQNNALNIDYTKIETIFGLPIRIDMNLEKDYEFIYDKKEWEDEYAE